MQYRPCFVMTPKVQHTGRGVSSLRIPCALPLCAFLFLLFSKAEVAANVAESLGLGARAVALGNAYTAIADDFSSVYYNPGGLSSAPESKLIIGALWARPYFYYQENGGARVRPHLYSTGSLYIGVSSNLAHLTGYSQLRKWTLGLNFYAPVERALLADIPNESTEKRFIFYLDQTQVMAIAAGLSFQIYPGLSIGVAGNFLADLRAPNEADVEADIRTVIPYLAGVSDLVKRVRPRIMRDAEIKAAPILGVRFTPVGWFSCGLTFRGKFYAETVGTQDILIRFKDFSGRSEGMLQSAVLADIHYIHYWTPNELAFGLAMRPRPDLLVAADLTWSDWSDYIDPQWRAPERKFSDTFTPRVGLEYLRPPGFAVRAGYGFQPSPVPEQTGAANYLDNDKHVFSFGVGYTFARSPLTIWKKPLTVNGYVQYHHLVKRHYRKTVEAGSENALSFGGHLVHAGVDIVLHF